MRVFISDLPSTLGLELARLVQDSGHEVLGSVGARAQLHVAKRRLQEHPASDRPGAVREPVAVVTDKPALARLVRLADVVVTSVAADPKHALELLKALEKAAAEQQQQQEEDRPPAEADDDAAAVEEPPLPTGVRRFIALSSVLTWSKNGPYAKGTRAHSEDAYKTRKPARAYSELKTAETQILSAQRPEVLETGVVAAGLIYGGAQTQLHRLFRDAWLHPTRPVVVPALPGAAVPRGGNLVPMISVYDLALVVFRAATTTGAPLPKSYMVATDRASATTSLRDLCLGLSALLGTGQIHETPTDAELDELVAADDDAADGNNDRDGGASASTTTSVGPLQLHLCFEGPSEGSAMSQLVAPDEFRHVDGGLLGHLAFFVRDFIASLDLRPLRVVVLGPPRVGKTTLSRRLARDYYLPHLTLAGVVDEVLQLPPPPGGDKSSSATDRTMSSPEVEAETEEPNAADKAPSDRDQDDEVLARLRVELGEWQQATGGGTGSGDLAALPETTALGLLRWKLMSATCRNQGYVLDGLPVSVAQATKLLELVPYDDEGAGGEGAEGAEGAGTEGEGAGAEGNGDKAPGDAPGEGAEAGEGGDPAGLSASRSRAILDKLRPRRQIQLPNRVLDAPRELLARRAQALSEDEALATGNTQGAFDARYAEFRAQSDGLATFFEQLRIPESTSSSSSTATTTTTGIEVLELHLDSDASYQDHDAFDGPIAKYVEQGGRGKPHNFHPTRDELRERERARVLKQQEDAARQRQLEREHDEREAAAQAARVAAERARLELIHREEAELLEARAKPLRTYLMDTVLPALTEGMLEVVKVQPDDPIDYLAEFLFRKGRDMETASGN